MIKYFALKSKDFDNIFRFSFYYSILLYIISLFVKDIPVITNVLMALIVLLALLSAIKNRFKDSLNNTINIGLILFFIIQIISALLSDDKNQGISVLVQRTPLLALPLSFCFIKIEKRVLNRLLLVLAVSTVIASVVGFLFGLTNYINTNDSGFLYNDNISCILGKQAVYFSFYVGVAILILFFQIKNMASEIKSYKILFLLAIVWLFFIEFMLASRAGMLSVLCIIIFDVMITTFKRKKYMDGVLIIMAVIIGAVIMGKSFPKTFNRFNGTFETSFRFDNNKVENHFNAAYDSTMWNGTNTRIAIWTCALDIIKEHVYFGTGIGDRNTVLTEKYKEKNFIYALKTQKNTHSQYIDVLLSMGAVGLLLFLVTYLIIPFYVLFKEKNKLGIAVFLLLAICMLTENMFDRYQGLVFVPFILGLAEKVRELGSDIKPHSPIN